MPVKEKNVNVKGKKEAKKDKKPKNLLSYYGFTKRDEKSYPQLWH